MTSDEILYKEGENFMLKLKDVRNYYKTKIFLLVFFSAIITYFLFNGLFIYFWDKPLFQIFSELIKRIL